MSNTQRKSIKRRDPRPRLEYRAVLLPLLCLAVVDRYNEVGVQAFQAAVRPLRPPTACYGNPFGKPDPPLSTIVKLPDEFTLAECPEDIIPLEENQRLVCVGDVHGDYDALVEFLKIAKVLKFENEEEENDEVEASDGKEKDDKNKTENNPENPGKDEKKDEKDVEKNATITANGEKEEEKKEIEMNVAMPAKDVPVWTGNNTILVQVGDVLDRGTEELACYQLLAQLSHQALEHGGKVICLYGNHEALNAQGLFQYALSDKEYEKVVGKIVDEQLTEYYREQEEDEEAKKAVKEPNWRAQYVGNQAARWTCFEPNGLLSRRLMKNLKVAVKVGKTLCVHAGLTADHIENHGGIEGMNEEARAYILGDGLDDTVSYNNQGEYISRRQPWIEAELRQTTYIDSIPEFLGGAIGKDKKLPPSPIWMRDYSSPADGPPKNQDAESMIDKALEAIGDCDRMVMGHTVQSQINAAFEGKAYRIDVGASQGVIGGRPEVLEIVNKNGTEEVAVLTKYGRVPGHERHIWAMAEFL
mmetsp:Transcript_34869/g.100381  ORF Transcript_34869/g.100381 Transcript_34869/m.100381 type:complete len:528 (-) Transcript_34869:44-1627(-)